MSAAEKSLDARIEEIADRAVAAVQCSGCDDKQCADRRKRPAILAALRAACEMQRERDAAVCEARAAEHYGKPDDYALVDVTAVRGGEAEDCAAAIRKGEG